MKNKTIKYLSIIIILGVIFSFIFFLVPYYIDFQRSKATLSAKDIQIETEKKESEKIREINEKLLTYKDEIKKIESAFPQKDLIIPEFYNFIRKETTANGVVLGSVGIGTTYPTSINPNIEKTIFSVSITAPYPVLKSFLSNLYENSRLISVESISINSSGESNLLNTNLSLGVYSYKK